MLNKYDLVYVEWIDHHADGRWSDMDDTAVDETLCVSIGWLFGETESALVLVSSVCEETRQVGNKQIIAKKLIHDRSIIRHRKQANNGAASVHKEGGRARRAMRGIEPEPTGNYPNAVSTPAAGE